MKKENRAIRKAAAIAGVPLWMVAERMKILPSNFSHLLRRELSKDKQDEIINIILEIEKENEQ